MTLTGLNDHNSPTKPQIIQVVWVTTHEDN